jgi:hypothetical protein
MDNNTFTLWDDGATYDRRVLNCTFLLNETDTQNLITIFRQSDRGANVNLIVTSGRGFYPFGPDKGDAGTFRCRMTKFIPRDIIDHPTDYWPSDCEFVYNGAAWPSFSIPASENEGELQIGTLTTLRFPDDYAKQDVEFNIKTIYTMDGTPHSNDFGTTGDSYTTSLGMIMRNGNAGKLLDYLLTVRTGDITIIPPTNSYIFSRENASTATYTCKQVLKDIVYRHELFDRWVSDFKFYRVSQA